MKNEHRKNRRGESGTALILGTASLIFIIPMVGLAVDTGFLYSAKSRLQASVDGASLAAARALNMGSTLQSQQATAAQNALNWFYANFPPATWATTGTSMSITGETNTAAGFGSAGQSVHIYPDATNPQLDHVDVTASTNVPTWFMRWFGYSTLNISAVGNATRRAAVVMMVLDRSHSMCMVGGALINGNNSCSKADTTTPCAQMITAAKQFTGQFAPGRDYIGLVSFAENGFVAQTPTQNFQTTLGYMNSSGQAVGTDAGSLDNIVCNGGTGTAQAISMGYQLLTQMNLPGALNIIMLETDGLPNTLTMNFWDNANTVSGLRNTDATHSPCKDTSSPTNKTKFGGGFNNNTVLRNWTSGLALNASPFLTTVGFYPNVPAGMIGAVPSEDPSGGDHFWIMMQYFTNSTASNYNTNTYLTTTNAPGCYFATSGGDYTTTPTDILWWPATDVYGNQTNPSNAYQLVTTDAQGHITQSGANPANWQNYHNAVLNATDNSAYRARANSANPAYVFAIGLGGNSVGGPPDPILLQRIANDPNGDQFNSTPYYLPCAQETGCITYGAGSGQYQGKFIFAPTSAQLNAAFLAISSQILRLNK